jgi:hypothetical protein
MTIAGLVIAVALLAPAAAAQEIAQVNDEVPIAAHRGWLAWSVKDGARFRLVAWHDGVLRTLPVRVRQRPFDVDVGTDARGRAVATFSRCRRFASVAVYEGRREVGVGCRARLVDLRTGTERGAGVPAAPGTSDTMPSMWRGRVAFARRDPRHHGNVDQVMLWTPKGRVLRTLRHGGTPGAVPPPSGEVTGLDLGGRLVAFSWRILAPSVIGHGGYELRADRLADGRSALVGSGYTGEACTGGIDGTSPRKPTVEGDHVWYMQSVSQCYRFSARLNSYRGFPVRGRRGDLEGIVRQAAKDGPDLYILVAPPNAPDQGPACTPCTIERIALPALQPIRLKPHSPF